jgi:hypothetical protein
MSKKPLTGAKIIISSAAQSLSPASARSVFKTAFEQDLWLECSRLIASCIIFYNASILSRLLEHQERIGDLQAADATKGLPHRMAAHQPPRTLRVPETA